VIGLDTSVVLRLLLGEPADQAGRARVLLDERLAHNAAAHVSDLVVSETYFALLHHYGVPHREAVRALVSLLVDPRVTATGVAQEVLGGMAAISSGAGLMDRLIHGDYLAHSDAAMVTFDRAAARLPGARLL
jgi:predicted nucleic acid-binding protein